ncbi:hypothetical protein P8767_20405 [Peribacillus frigoritolerans]|nr:hypothetical protein [Peribacillus frigoritolerans]MDG4849666.1 hypothetical protein [Peribacillus frigoritolerans]
MTRTIGLICGSLRENLYNRIIAQSLIDIVDSHHLNPPFRTSTYLS